jgi:PHS family inorganic phosphate transporter-like MFS transporter
VTASAKSATLTVADFGPNTTTFVIPGEVFPTRYRSTAHGISAASGKLGAIVAQVGFARLINIGGTGKFLPHILEICELSHVPRDNANLLVALFMLTGIFSTLLLPETKGLSLEDLSQEDQSAFGQTSNGNALDRESYGKAGQQSDHASE